MGSFSGGVRKTVIFVHRWLGIGLCLLFLLWFPSGIGMMYWGFPDVSAADQLRHSPPLDPATIKVSPAEAWAKVAPNEPAPAAVLNSFDARPVYRFITGFGPEAVVYADTGELQQDVTPAMMLRVASAWTHQPADRASVEQLQDVDQWTVQGLRDPPVWKYSWPSGDQVYVSQASGEVVQATTTASRLGAYLGPIPHWIYFTPIRKHARQWNSFVVWTSAIGTGSALLGVIIGVWMYSPRKRYRNAGAPTSIPYRGQKRLHTLFGLIFGIATVTWTFSGLLTMDPFQLDNDPSPAEIEAVSAIESALRSPAPASAFAGRDPRAALTALAGQPATQLEMATVAGEPVYMATLAGGGTRIVPLTGAPREEVDRQRLMDVVRQAAQPIGVSELRLVDQYDRYYLDRRGRAPLPVILARVNDEGQSRYYIDPKTARIVGGHNARNWFSRWVYHAMHSFDFPWLYNYRPVWDVVVIVFMLGGTALAVTSLILAWRALGRTLGRLFAGGAANHTAPGEDDLVTGVE